MKKYLALLGMAIAAVFGWAVEQPALPIAIGVATFLEIPQAFATNCGSYTYTLTNGQTADANQVMANFNTILNCGNNNLAHNGANSDITSLSGLTTPLSVPQGGTGLGTLTANALLLGNGASTPNFLSPGASGTLINSNGTAWVTTSPASLSANLCQPTLTIETASGTYTTPTCNGQTANWLWITARGAGGGGGYVSGSTCATAGTGGDTIFNSVHAGGGIGGATTAAPGAGGTSSTGTAFRQPGAIGQMGWSNGTVYIGGSGGGDGGAGGSNGGGANAAANSGAGGGGQGSNANSLSCSGGGQGELAQFLVTSPTGSYAFTIGAAGSSSAGLGGTGVLSVLAGWQ